MSDALGYVPSGHAGWSSREEPRGQKEPAKHGVHDEAPVSFWYVDAGHSSQVTLMRAAAWLPGAQADGNVEPVEHSLPRVQLLHCSALDRSVAPLYVPAGHASGADAP